MEDKGKYKRMTFSFTEADSDIVEYLETLKKSGKASEYVREAIREKMNKEGATCSTNQPIDEDKLREIVEDMVINILSNTRKTTTHPPVEKKELKEEIDSAVLNAIDSFEF
jgi:hypothetical protein